MAGSGKTHHAIQEFLKYEGNNKVMLSFTNKACNVVRKRFQDKGI